VVDAGHEDIGTVVAEARKFGLGFLLAHQNLEQLREFSAYSGRQNQSLFAAVMGNVANSVVFRPGVVDAELLGSHVGVKSSSLLKVGRYEALARLTLDGREVGPFTLRPPLARTPANPRNVARLEELIRKPGGPWRTLDDAEAAIKGTLAADKADAHNRVQESNFLDDWLKSRRTREVSSSVVSASEVVGMLRGAVEMHSPPPALADALLDWSEARRRRLSSPDQVVRDPEAKE
jgi:hypothetical protein